MKQPRPEVKGFFEPNLRLMNQFKRGYLYLFDNPQRPVAELPEEPPADIIWPQPVAKFETKDSIQLAQGSGETQIGHQTIAQLPSAHNIILIQSQEKKRAVAKYALRGIDKPIGISDYELTRALPDNLKSVLPTIEEIEEELSADLKDENEGGL